MVKRVRRRRRKSLARVMLDIGLMVTFLGAVAIVTAWLEQRATQTLSGPIKVIDGDSLEINGIEARLRGIDAPEYTQTCRKNAADYACGREARAHLADLVKQAGAGLSCSGFETDKYERLLVICTRDGETMSINTKMVRDGWAVAYGGNEAEERSAKAAGRGLWQGDFDRPSNWRATHGSLAETPHTSRLIGWIERIKLWLGFSGKEDNERI